MEEIAIAYPSCPSVGQCPSKGTFCNNDPNSPSSPMRIFRMPLYMVAWIKANIKQYQICGKDRLYSFILLISSLVWMI